jgi:hypothetical protein
VLKLVNNCTPDNTDCTWTYQKGMWFSDTNSGLAVNAFGGAANGTVLKLVNNCAANLTDCTWTFRKGMLLSDTNPGLAINAYGGAANGTVLKLVNNCGANLTDCTWTYSGNRGPASIAVSATETQLGPDICATGSGGPPGGSASAEYFGIPGRTAPRAGSSANVKPDGSFKIVDTTQEGSLVGQCSNDQIQSTVTITVTEEDVNGNVIASGSGTMPGSYWCAIAPVSTNFNGGCP